MLWEGAVKEIHSIRSKALYYRQLKQLLLDLQAEYGDVVYHTDVSWLTSGSLREPIQELSDLAFSVDTTKHLSALNVSLRGPDAVVSRLYEHIKAFGTNL